MARTPHRGQGSRCQWVYGPEGWRRGRAPEGESPALRWMTAAHPGTVCQPVAVGQRRPWPALWSGNWGGQIGGLGILGVGREGCWVTGKGVGVYKGRWRGEFAEMVEEGYKGRRQGGCMVKEEECKARRQGGCKEKTQQRKKECKEGAEWAQRKG